MVEMASTETHSFVDPSSFWAKQKQAPTSTEETQMLRLNRPARSETNARSLIVAEMVAEKDEECAEEFLHKHTYFGHMGWHRNNNSKEGHTDRHSNCGAKRVVEHIN